MLFRTEKIDVATESAPAPFLPDAESQVATTTLAELRERMQKVEQQVLAQYTATAAYATLAQQAVEQARAEARADLDRTHATLITLLEQVRAEHTAVPDGLAGRVRAHDAFAGTETVAALDRRVAELADAFELSQRENRHLREQVRILVRRQQRTEGWLDTSGDAVELSLR